MKDREEPPDLRDVPETRVSTKGNPRGYEKPALIKRARLSEVTAVSKTSGISTDT
jgi:hypothetical protein